MKDNLVIIDNDFLNKDQIKNIESRTKNTFWTYQDSLGSGKDGVGGVKGGDFADYPYFVSLPTTSGNEDISLICQEVLKTFANKHGLIIDKIFRERSNISTRTLMTTTSRPHVDTLDNDHYVFLYYANDSDGDTILYNEYADRNKFYNHNDVSINQIISPEAGKAILFPGKQFHSWSGPTENHIRIILNMNVSFIESN